MCQLGLLKLTFLSDSSSLFAGLTSVYFRHPGGRGSSRAEMIWLLMVTDVSRKQFKVYFGNYGVC